MDIRIVDFEPEHFERMPVRAEDAADFAGMNPGPLLEGWKKGRTVLYRGEPAFFYGARIDFGTGYLWAVSSVLTDRLPLLTVRLGRATVRSLFNAGCHRVEAYCHAGNLRSLNWLTRSLGFSVEGVMRKCGPNRQDRFLLSILRNDY